MIKKTGKNTSSGKVTRLLLSFSALKKIDSSNLANSPGGKRNFIVCDMKDHIEGKGLSDE